LLRDGLDDEVGVLQACVVGGPADAPGDGVPLVLLEPATGDLAVQRRLDALTAPGDGGVVDLDVAHLDAVARDDLGDAGPHGPASDDPDGLDLLGHGGALPRRRRRDRARGYVGRAPPTK